MKVPRVQQSSSFHDVIFETQLLKILESKQSGSHLVKVKEEIFQINLEQNTALNYAVIFEKPTLTLFDMLTAPQLTDSPNTETSSNRGGGGASSSNHQIFTAEKYLYLCYQSLLMLKALEQDNIYVGSLSPSTLLISDDYQLQINNFQVAIVG